MRERLGISTFVIVLLLMCSWAGGEVRNDPPRGGEARWHETVEQFAAAMAARDPEAVNRSLAERALIRELDRREPGTVSRLMSRTEGAQVVGVMAYPRPPAKLAADIVEAVEQSPFIPPHVREWMAPSDESGMQRANATAARWVNEAVETTEQCAVGVILLWCPVQTWPGASGDHAKNHQLVFVMVKGTPAVGQPDRIGVVAFGNPHPAARQ